MVEPTTRPVLQPSPPAAPGRILELDALRGLAALAVVFYHYTTRYDQIYGHTADLPLSVPVGRYGVLLFFMLSGFVISMSLERTHRLLDFVVKRAARLYPTYWVAIALTFSVVSVFGLPGRQVSASAALLNGLMFHPFFNVPDVDGVYWTLLVELIFYGLMGGLFAIKALAHIELVMGLWLGINAVVNHTGLVYLPAWIIPGLILPYAHFFIMGIVLYRLGRYGGSPLRYGLLAACFASHLALAPEVDKHIAVVLFIATFFLINAGRLRAIAVPPLLALGTLSYPLYLIHQNVGYVVIRTLEEWGVSPTLSIVAATSVAIALALPIAHYVEQPSLRWVKKAYRRWGGESVPPRR